MLSNKFLRESSFLRIFSSAHFSAEPSLLKHFLFFGRKFYRESNMNNNGLQVRVVAGEASSSKTFHVFKATLCRTSPFFEKALNGPFLESLTQAIHLPGLHPDVFSLFLNWTVTGKLPDPKNFQRPNPYAKDPTDENHWDFLISSAMVFAELHMIDSFAEALRKAFFTVHFPKLENNVDSALRYWHSFPTHTTMARIFDGVPSGAALARKIANAILAFFDDDVPFRTPFLLPLDIQRDVLENGTIYARDEYGLLRVDLSKAEDAERPPPAEM